jgi:hypothetical protein
MTSLDAPLTDEDKKMTVAAKKRPWWMNPGYTAEAPIEFKGPSDIKLNGLPEFPIGTYEFLDSPEDRTTAQPLRARVDEGEFSPFATILFMINGHRPGPVPGFYVIVEAIKGKAWCVGQVHADATTPLRVFRTPMYDSESEARRAAEKLRLADVGNAPPRI